MKNNELIDQFLEFELQHNLFKLEISGIKVWDFIRVKIYSQLLNESAKIEVLRKKDSERKVFSFFSGLISFVLSIVNNFNCKLSQTDILVLNHPRRKKIDNKFVDIYTDYVIEELNDLSTISLETLNRMKHNRPAYTKKLYYLDGIDFFGRFANYFHKKILSRDDQKKIVKLTDSINQTFSISINPNTIIKFCCRIKYYYNSVEKIILKVNPQVILCVDSYNIIRRTFCAVGKKINIPIIELQHGVMGAYHIGYNYPQNESGYFPDYFFSWGAYWHKESRLPYSVKIIDMGFPYFDKEKNEPVKFNFDKSKKSVLVISTPQNGIKLAKIVNQAALNLLEFNFYFKLHPSEFDTIEIYDKIMNSDNIYIFKENLYDLFKVCEWQIGVESTALVEGLGFGLNTIIIKLKNYKYFENLFDYKGVTVVKDYPEIVEILEKIGQKEAVSVDSNYFFYNDSVIKLKEEITKILKS